MSLGVGTFAAAGNAASLADPAFKFGGSAFDSGSKSSFSISLTGLGDAYAERYVLLGICGGANSASFSGVTIGGQPANLINVVNTGSMYQRLVIAKVPTGGSATAVVTFSSNVSSLVSAWCVLTDLQSMSPVSQGTDSGKNTTSANVSIPDKGICVGYWRVSYGVSPGTNSWSSPMSMVLNQNFSSQQRQSMGFRIAAGNIASYNVQHSFNYNTTVMNVAVFR